MKPLVVLSASFIVIVVFFKYFTGVHNVVFAGNFAMCITLLFTALGHFKYTKGMVMMMPDFIPYKRPLVYVSGLMQIILGILLLFQEYRYVAGFATITLFIMIVPANVTAAFKHVDYINANYNRLNCGYLWFRIPMQLYLLSWVFYFSIYRM
jgi:uncharacterized membrane protein